MPAAENALTAAAIGANENIKAREVDFVTRFNKNWESLRQVLGIMRPIRKTPGTVLTSIKAKVTLADSVGEGEDIAFSRTDYTVAKKADLTVEKYATAVTIEAVAKYGAELAVEKVDDAFLDELQAKVMGEFYDFLQTGTLTSTEAGFQMAISMAIGRVADKFKRMHRGVGEIVVFANTLDAYKYLGGANIIVQTQNGIQYVESFLGAKTLILSSDIPEGKVIATPQDNIDLYYVDPADSDFTALGLDFTVAGETNLIGFHAEGKYSNATGESYAIMGMKLWASARECPRCGGRMGVVGHSERTVPGGRWRELRCPRCGHRADEWTPRRAKTG